MATKSERERASRLRRKVRGGDELSARDRRWLDKYEAENRRVARRVQRSEPVEDAQTVEPESADVAPEPVAPEPEPEMVEIAGELPATPSAAPPADAPGGAPGATPALPTLHRAPCPVGPDCPGCAGLLDVKAQICATTGREVWPAIGEDEAEGWAHALLEGVGLLVRWIARQFFGRRLRAVDPSSLEVSRASRALRVAARRRPLVAELAHSAGDIVSLAMTARAYGARSWAALPESSGAAGD